MSLFKVGDIVIDNARQDPKALVISVLDRSEATKVDGTKLFPDLSESERYVYKVRFYAYGVSNESGWIEEKNLVLF